MSNKYKTVSLSGGYTIQVAKKISFNKIKLLLQEYQLLLSQLDTLTSNATENSIFLLYILILRHFTSLPIPFDLNKMIVVAEYLTELKVFDEIFTKGFTKSQINTILRHSKKYINEVSAKDATV
jgi:hypothetical protein